MVPGTKGESAADEGPTGLRVFLSYRRADTPAWAHLLHATLRVRFDPFMDIDGIRPGSNFVRVLKAQLRDCDASLAIIGRQWITLPGDDGTPRLLDPHDYVRLEIEEALRRKILLIPVLVDGAPMPSANDLPASCAPLAQLQAVRLTHETFNHDAQRLVRSLDALTEQRASRAAAAAEREAERRRQLIDRILKR